MSNNIHCIIVTYNDVCITLLCMYASSQECVQNNTNGEIYYQTNY